MISLLWTTTQSFFTTMLVSVVKHHTRQTIGIDIYLQDEPRVDSRSSCEAASLFPRFALCVCATTRPARRGDNRNVPFICVCRQSKKALGCFWIFGTSGCLWGWFWHEQRARADVEVAQTTRPNHRVPPTTLLSWWSFTCNRTP